MDRPDRSVLLDDQTIAAMRDPVACTCSRVYDLAAVRTNRGFGGVTTWTAPCCGRKATGRDVERLRMSGTAAEIVAAVLCDRCGRPRRCGCESAPDAVVVVSVPSRPGPAKQGRRAA